MLSLGFFISLMCSALALQAVQYLRGIKGEHPEFILTGKPPFFSLFFAQKKKQKNKKKQRMSKVFINI